MTSQVSESTNQDRVSADHKSDQAPSPTHADASIPARILIVDDDPVVLMAMETLLDGPSRIIMKAETGQDALRHLLRHDFAVILLDVRMPRLDGYETAALVRQRERSRYTPIIFLSGVDTLNEDVLRGLTSGAVDYLVKPVVPEILKSKVSVFVDLYRLRERVKQKAVQQSEERFRLLVEGVQDYAIFMLDGEGLVTTWNNGAERLTGYGGAEILGRHYEGFYPDEELASDQPARDLQMAAAAQEYRVEQDRWMIRKDSTRFIANVVVTGLRDERGSLQGYAVVIRDVTERKSAEDALQRLTSELEERVAERTSELVQMHSRLRAFAMQLNLTEQRERRRLASDLHDYLAQLLVVLRMKILQTGPLISSNKKAVSLLKEADQTVAQSLEYTRSLVTDLAPPSLHDFGLLEALEWLASRVRQHGLSTAVKRHVETLPLPEDHAVLIYQSVRELLFNVLKHAAASRATISVAMTPEETLEVTVTDDGHGFDPAPIATLVAGLSGFGLFSTRERMESIGGRLELHSAIGQGTRATLIVPYTSANATAPPTTQEPLGTQHSAPSSERSAPLSALVPLRVLLVDDHVIVRQGLRSLLEGHDDVQIVGEAGDGEVGIELAGSLNPDVVVMDVTMPRIDGVEATRRIRQSHPSIAVVALSVHRTSQVEAAMKAAGAALFISKDSAGDELYEAIVAAGGMRNRGIERESLKIDDSSRNQC